MDSACQRFGLRVYTGTKGDNLKLREFTVMSAAYGRHALKQFISACPWKKKKSRSETITEMFSV